MTTRLDLINKLALAKEKANNRRTIWKTLHQDQFESENTRLKEFCKKLLIEHQSLVEKYNDLVEQFNKKTSEASEYMTLLKPHMLKEAVKSCPYI